MVCVTLLFDFNTLLVENRYSLSSGNYDSTLSSVLLGVNIHTSDSTYIAGTCVCFHILEVFCEVLTKLGSVSTVNKSESLRSDLLRLIISAFNVQTCNSIYESGEVELICKNNHGSLLELAVNVTIHGVEQVSTHMTSADRNEHRVGHFLFVKILELVLCHENLVLLRGVRNLNGLGVTFTHTELFSAVGGFVDVNLANHTSSTHERVINSTELL